MMDPSNSTFARRAKLSKLSICLATALTLAALIAVLYSSGVTEPRDLSIQSPISDANAQTGN